MIWYICFTLAVICFGMLIAMLFHKRLAKTRMLFVLLFCALSAYALYVPYFYLQYDFLAALFGSVINILQIVTLESDYLTMYEMLTAQTGGIITGWYLVFLGAVHIMLPAVSAMTALTLIVQYLSNIKLNSINKHKKPLHIFSELSYESVMLCRDIKKHNRKCEILFLGDTEDPDYADIRSELGCSVINENIENIRIGKTKRRIYFYCIHKDREQNLNSALAILKNMESCQKEVQQNTHLYIFTEDPAAEMIVDSVPKGFVNISIVDTARTAAYGLLNQYPLERYAIRKKIHMLICGFTPMGKMVLRTAAWCGQLFGYGLQITVLDKDIRTAAADFRAEYPGLFSERYDIRLLSYADEEELFKLLQENASDANYIVVAHSDSEQTVDKAVKLRRHYYKADPGYQNTPPIFAYIENEARANAVAMLQTAEAKQERRVSYDIVPFGVVSQIYSSETITNSHLDILAKNVHLVYEDIFSDGPIDVEGALERYNLFEVNKNSNRANAMHIRYKLLMLGLDYTDDPDAREVELSEYLSDERLEELTYAEHDRWMAFLESEGWVGSTVEQAESYKASGISRGRHNCPILKLHPYICPFEELQDCSDRLGLPDSTVYDRELIRRIPDILHDKWNISDKAYKIIKKHNFKR